MPILDSVIVKRFGALIAHRETRSGVRYLVVIVAGYLIDFGISVSAFKFFGLPLMASAAIGFFVAAVINYIAHEFWTFEGERDPKYASRLTKYLLVSVFTLSLRSGFIFVLEPFAWSDLSRIAVLISAAAFSMIANYSLSRIAVFK